MRVTIPAVDDRWTTATHDLWNSYHGAVDTAEILIGAAFGHLNEITFTLGLDADERRREVERLAGRLHHAVDLASVT